jgi:Xaa-Pro aminopeptidase
MGIHANRLRKIVELMNQRGLGGLIIFSDGTGDISFPRYLQYFAGFKPIGAKNAVFITKEEKVVLVIEPKWDALRVSKKTWIEDVRGSSNFVKDLKNIIKELDFKGPTGLVGSKLMRKDTYDCLNKELDIQLSDEIIEAVAKDKSPEELAIIRRTAKIADKGFEAFLAHAKVGIREYELFAEMEYAMRSEGSDDGFNLIDSGRHNYAMHAPTDRRLGEGDIIIAEITSVCEGNYSHLCRTVVLGEPSSKLIGIYTILVNALNAALEQIMPGKPASILSREINRVIGEAGYAKYCRPPYMRVRGHGFGVGSVAPGTIIHDDTDEAIEKHHVLAVHPNQYIPETGYLACGETVLVTESGIERLTKTESKIYVK